jgi:hypothetical protein
MNNFEFRSYTPTPTDQYGMLGIAKVKLYGKIVVNFKHVKTKDGTGSFFCTNNYTITDAMGDKKYLACVQLDSRDDEDMLMEFIRENVNKVLAQRSVQFDNISKSLVDSTIGAIKQQGNYYPHGLTQQTQPAPTSMSEVAAQEQLPF